VSEEQIKMRASTEGDNFTQIAIEAFGVLYHAIKRRDEEGLKPEEIRVARALCMSDGGHPDQLVHWGEAACNGAGNRTHLCLYQGQLSMGWRLYVHRAKNAIDNLDAARQEEAEVMVRDTETIEAGPSLPDGFVSGEISGVSDSLSDPALEEMVEFLAAIFDIGPDGDSAICRQTGEPFDTVAIMWKSDGVTADDQMAKKILIRDATKAILEMAKEGQHTLYWRKRPEIAKDGADLKFYARVAFGP
jgi:hypothetical protein